MVIQNGIHSFPWEQYDASAAVSKSMLDKIAITPAHLRAYLDEPRPAATEAQKLGVLVHRLCLEPDTMKDAFHVKPDGMTFTTKDGKAWRDEHQDRPIIPADAAARIQRMVASVHSHPAAKRLLHNAKCEQCLFAEDDHGTQRKARLDALTAGNVIPDLKTCKSAELRQFERSILNYRYHVQAAYYIDICNLLDIEKAHFVFIAVENEPPFAVCCYKLDPIAIEAGRMEYQRDLTLYRHCVEASEWPSYSLEIEDISLPDWARKQYENIVA